MGKGDRRTTKGKISIRSYGNKRPHSNRKAIAAPAAKAVPAKAAPVKTAAKKATASTAAAKKKTAG